MVKVAAFKNLALTFGRSRQVQTLGSVKRIATPIVMGDGRSPRCSINGGVKMEVSNSRAAIELANATTQTVRRLLQSRSQVANGEVLLA